MDFIVITGPTISQALRKIKRAEKIDAGIELRLDLFQSYSHEEIKEILALCKSLNKKVIFTLRSKDSGGGFSGSKEALIDEIKALSKLHPDYMDIEWHLPKELFNSVEETKTIASHHDYYKTPISLGHILSQMLEKQAYAYKICTTAQETSDSFRMINFIHKQKKQNLNIIGLCMGEKGKITRTDGLKVGNYLNYKIIHIGDKVAPGIDFS
jgi:3-dehydroquinate dehydratase type I